MAISLLIPLFFLFPKAEGADDWWDDFAGNLATDLAPFIGLFGEAPTKQFLSESLTVLDYFIFAMAPIGILTAVVSAIRVRGGSSLRAFIGRSQDGQGVIDAELCSSTSHDVCELYNSGGIARTMGRPQILEVVCNSKAPDEDFFDKEENATAGIYPTQQYLQMPCLQRHGAGDDWEEVVPKLGGFLGYKCKYGLAENRQEAQPLMAESQQFAPHPNLTLNIWMRRQSFHTLLAVALIGAILQSSVVAYAAVLTFSLKYKKEGSVAPGYGFPLLAGGTIGLCSGIFLCAFLVGESTTERAFRRTKAAKDEDSLPEFVWMQPGRQRIGDQTFDAFAYSDVDARLAEYTTSWKPTSRTSHAFENNNFFRRRSYDRHLSWKARIRDAKRWLTIYAAISLSTVGFISQLIGIRSLHSSISIVQLGAMLIMSALRSLIRSQRMETSSNLLEGLSDSVQGHELDWLAVNLARRDTDDLDVKDLWFQTAAQPVMPDFSNRGSRSNNSSVLLLRDDADWIKCKAQLEEARHKKLAICGSTERPHPFSTQKLLGNKPSLPQKIFMMRRRLAQLTRQGDSHPQFLSPAYMINWSAERVVARDLAVSLAIAIRQTADVLFSGSTQFSGSWKDALSFQWQFECMPIRHHYRSAPIYLRIWRKSSVAKWETDLDALEAIVGLWLWSIHSDTRLESTISTTETSSVQVSNHRIISDQKCSGGLLPFDQTAWLGRNELKAISIKEILLEATHESIAENYNTLTYSPWDIFMGNPRNPDKLDAFTGRTSYPKSGMSAARLFGWNNIRVTRAQISSGLLINIANSTLPLPQLFAQDVFASFIQALFQLVDKIGGKTELNAFRNRYLELENTELAKIFDVFKDSKLGSHRDALLTVLPAIGFERLRTRELLVGTSRRQARDFRREGRWDDASRILLSAWYSVTNVEHLPMHSVHGETDPVASVLVLVLESHRRAIWRLPDVGPSLTEKDKGQFQYVQIRLRAELMHYISFLYPETARTPLTPAIALIKCYHDAVLALTSLEYTPTALKMCYDNHLQTERGAQQKMPTEPTPLKLSKECGPFRVTESFFTNLLWLGNPKSELSEDQLTANLFLAVQTDNLRISNSENDIDLPPVFKNAARSIILETLLDSGAEVNATDDAFGGPGRTAVSYAAENGHKQTIEILHEAGAKLGRKDKDRKSTLHYAASHGHYDIVRMLILCDEKLLLETDADDVDKCTPLVYAIANKHKAVARLISSSSWQYVPTELRLLSSANLDDIARTPSAIKPLLSSSHLKHEDVARHIMATGGYRLTNGMCKSVFESAIRHERFDLARLLLLDELVMCPGHEYVLGDNTKPEGFGFLVDTVQNGDLQALESLLERRNPSVVPQDEARCALTLAARGGHRDVVQFLLTEARVELDKTKSAVREEMTMALGYAIKHGHVEVVETILDIGKVPVGQQDPFGQTLLMLASRFGRMDILQMLLKVEGAPDIVNQGNKRGQTALMLAAKFGHAEVVKRLLRVEKVDVSKVDNKSRNALVLAWQGGHDDIVRRLRDAETIILDKFRDEIGRHTSEPDRWPRNIRRTWSVDWLEILEPQYLPDGGIINTREEDEGKN